MSYCENYLKAYQYFKELQKWNLIEALLDYNYDLEKMIDESRELHRQGYDDGYMTEEEWNEINQLFYDTEDYADEIEEIAKLWYNDYDDHENFYKNFIEFLIKECL